MSGGHGEGGVGGGLGFTGERGIIKLKTYLIQGPHCYNLGCVEGN